VRIDTDGDATFFGQFLDIYVCETDPGKIRVAGRGEILAVTNETEVLDATPMPFGSAERSDADPMLVRLCFDRLRGRNAGLEIGSMRQVFTQPACNVSGWRVCPRPADPPGLELRAGRGVGGRTDLGRSDAVSNRDPLFGRGRQRLSGDMGGTSR
jgi:hypothetical protein